MLLDKMPSAYQDLTTEFYSEKRTLFTMTLPTVPSRDLIQGSPTPTPTQRCERRWTRSCQFFPTLSQFMAEKAFTQSFRLFYAESVLVLILTLFACLPPPHHHSPAPTPPLWRMFVFRLKYFLWLLKSPWICFVRSYVKLYGTKMSILGNWNSSVWKQFSSDMMVLSIEFDKQEMKFMFRPPNCCNMSSCEGKCRPRDPFPTIALLEMRMFYIKDIVFHVNHFQL